MLDDPAEEAAALAIADVMREGRAQFGALIAEYKAEVAELRAVNAELRAERAERSALVAELTAKIEARLATVKNGDPGQSVTLADVEPLIEAATAKAGDAIPEMVEAAVATAVAALPPAQPGAPGRSVTVDDVAPLVVSEVAKAMADVPAPQPGAPGESVTAEDVVPMLKDMVERAVAALPKPESGVGVAGAMIDRDGGLVLTLSNGQICNLGSVVGRSVEESAVKEMVRAAVDSIPKAADGLGFDDLDVVDEPTTFVLRFVKGERTREFRLAKPTLADAYRGVWKAGDYRKGDVVTLGGSLWIAAANTAARPDADDAWRLCVKKGRDGADLREPKPVQPTTVRV